MMNVLSLQGLTAIDSGIVAARFDADLAACLEDIADRAHDTGKRSVQLTISLVPVPQSQGSEVMTEVQIKSSVPVARSKAFAMSLRRAPSTVSGGMRTLQAVWNELAPDDPRQLTLDDLNEEVDND